MRIKTVTYDMAEERGDQGATKALTIRNVFLRGKASFFQSG